MEGDLKRTAAAAVRSLEKRGRTSRVPVAMRETVPSFSAPTAAPSSRSHARVPRGSLFTGRPSASLRNPAPHQLGIQRCRRALLSPMDVQAAEQLIAAFLLELSAPLR